MTKTCIQRKIREVISRQERNVAGRGVLRTATTMLIGVAVLASFARAADPMLTYKKSVELPVLTDESLVAVPIDADVYAVTREDLADIRLLNAEGQPVPYLMRKRQATRARLERKTWTARNPTVRALENGGLEITTSLDADDPQPTGLRLITPLRNFEQRIRIQTSRDGIAWELAAADGTIFDYSRYIDVRKDELAIPETSNRYFRIIIDDVTAEQESQLIEFSRRLRGDEEIASTERFSIDRRPFRIDRIQFYCEAEREQSAGDEPAEYPVTSFAVEESTDDKRTIITIETRNEPLNSFAIRTPSRNFSRRAQVQIEHVAEVNHTWTTIGENTISRIVFGDELREELQIAFPQTRRKAYRILIENRDSPPLTIDGLAAEGKAFELVMFAQPAGEYTLVYADAHADAPQYDVAALQTLLDSGIQPLQAKLGSQQTRQQTIPVAILPRRRNWGDLINNPALLISLVVVLVVALGWGLYQASRRIDSLPKDGDL